VAQHINDLNHDIRCINDGKVPIPQGAQHLPGRSLPANESADKYPVSITARIGYPFPTSFNISSNFLIAKLCVESGKAISKFVKAHQHFVFLPWLVAE
jgi:hypothetical protein